MKLNLTISILVMSILVGCDKSDSKYSEIACTFAPSQSQMISSLSGTGTGAAASTWGLAKALGLSVVPHSSGSLILTGSSGYLAGTLGSAIAGPAIIAVGTVIGGSAVTLELLCAPVNHPEGYEAVLKTSVEFQKSLGNRFQNLSLATTEKTQDAITITKDNLRVVNGRLTELIKRAWN